MLQRHRCHMPALTWAWHLHHNRRTSYRLIKIIMEEVRQLVRLQILDMEDKVHIRRVTSSIPGSKAVLRICPKSLPAVISFVGDVCSGFRWL